MSTFPASFPSSHTQVIAIIGDPIEHSITPRIQNAAWQALRESGIDADFVNVAFRVAPENLEAAIRGAQAQGLLGMMVTIPHKQEVLRLCDELDISARLIGAANLLHFREDGKIIGHSSDGWAAIKSLGEQKVVVTGRRICLLGGGGAARSLGLTLALEGASEIVVLNRTVERAQTIVEELLPLGVAARADSMDEDTLRATLPDCDVLVNATSVGMHPHEEESPIAASVMHAGLAVYDIVYNPLETQLLRDARAAGARAVDGLGMLIYTNVYAAKVCAGHTISPVVMRKEALNALGY